MRTFKITLASIAIAAFASLAAQAKNEPTTAYMFGFASSFNDSTVYITSVQRVDSVYLTNKKLFLQDRENYSYQLRDYLEQNGEPKRTCLVIFDTNFKKAEKKWSKLYERYTKQPKVKRLKNGQKAEGLPTPWQVKSIDESKFMFKAVEPTEEAEEPKLTKAEKKAKKQEAKQALKKQKEQAKETKLKAKEIKAQAKETKAKAKKAKA